MCRTFPTCEATDVVMGTSAGRGVTMVWPSAAIQQ